MAQRAGQPRRSHVPTTPPKPWGWIAACVVVVVAAAGVLTYAVLRANDDAPAAAEPAAIDGVQVFSYPGGLHTYDAVDYAEDPPVGGQHDYLWADCTGTVYDIDIRHENAVHSLEHGAVWITYNPDLATADDIAILTNLVDGRPGLMLSPYPGLETAISLQAWGHQLGLDAATDARVEQFVDALTFNPDTTPEPGATCESPLFLDNPRLAGS
jgi:hypothetical protein